MGFLRRYRKKEGESSLTRSLENGQDVEQGALVVVKKDESSDVD